MSMESLHSFDESAWHTLLHSIGRGRCAPLIGAGASGGTFPLGAEIAHEWAAKYHYPFSDSNDLSRVAQYLAVTQTPIFPKQRLARQLRGIKPDLSDPASPYRVLAELPLPLYITTNYDDSMSQALRESGKEARQETCHWYDRLQTEPRSEYEQSAPPQLLRPLVFHLYGHVKEPKSMVLSEDDCIDFLTSIGRNPDALPIYLQKSFASSTLLFLGFQPTSVHFRVLYSALRGFMNSNPSRSHFVVALPPGGVEGGNTDSRAAKYLQRYFEASRVRVYWGTVAEFISELRDRWSHL